MELSRRGFNVLCAVVELYIRSGGPVASAEVAKFSRLCLSPATIRNVMAELEEAGYLDRPHASAGTVPSDLTLRLYVDRVPGGRRLSPKMRADLERRMEGMRRELVEDFAWVARLTAEATNEAGVAVRPFASDRFLEAVSLVALDGGRVLGILVTADGTVEKRLLRVESALTRDRLQRIANYLTSEFHGLNLDEITQTVSAPDGDAAKPPRDELERQAMEIISELLPSERGRVEVQVAGTENLLQTEEFTEIERVRSLFATLDDDQRIVREIRRALTGRQTQVIIGRESTLTESGGLGVVTTLFYKDGRRAGALGVVGSRRMDYARIVPVVEFIGDSLTRMLQESGAMNG
ncbi:MAG: heat-inducible transcriptional repressor HrcA [Thermoanaerobaculales bacterium]|nr:heat-inducible transcriptional repressor HrcA [Thermoanaerobaculales bacterium]